MPVKKRVTIYDIAKELGISTATVNRALTGKPRVSERTRELVLSKAEEMDFKPNALARSLARKSIRLAVVAETGFPEFHGYFLDGARDAAADLEDYNTHVDYFNYEGGTANTPESDAYLETTLNRIARERYDGVLICAKQTAALETLKEYGVCVATAINDVERHLRKFCISYNGRIAGAIAAELMARLMPPGAKAAVASAVTGPGIHSQIVDGFLAQVKVIPLNLVDIFYHYDHEGISYEMTNALLERHPDLGGIYVNSFNSRGVIRSGRRTRAGREDPADHVRHLQGAPEPYRMRNRYRIHLPKSVRTGPGGAAYALPRGQRRGRNARYDAHPPPNHPAQQSGTFLNGFPALRRGNFLLIYSSPRTKFANIILNNCLRRFLAHALNYFVIGIYRQRRL